MAVLNIPYFYDRSGFVVVRLDNIRREFPRLKKIRVCLYVTIL